MKTQLETHKVMTTQWRELYESMAAKGGSNQLQSQSQYSRSTPTQGCPCWVFLALALSPFPQKYSALTPFLGVVASSLRHTELTHPLPIFGGGGVSMDMSQYQ